MEAAQHIANHESPQTTKLYDRRSVLLSSVSAEATIYAERVIPSFFARRSISAIWLLRAVMLNRPAFSATSTFTRNATAPFMAGSFARTSSQNVEDRSRRDRLSVLHHPLNMQAQRFDRHPPRFVERLASRHTARKIRKAYTKIRLPVFMKIGNVLHDFAPFSRRDHISLIPACFSMLCNVPKGMSLFGCGTVARPFFYGCLNCLWLPT